MADAAPQTSPTVPQLPIPPGLVAEDVGRVNEALASSRSPVTRRAYASQWRMFTAWTGDRGQGAFQPARRPIRCRRIPDRARRLRRVHPDGATLPRRYRSFPPGCQP